MSAVEADDGQAPSCITDHVYTPPAGQPWARCVICSISEAAHARTLDVYPINHLPYRCPYCVDRGVEPCLHGRRDALDMKGQPLGGSDGLR